MSENEHSLPNVLHTLQELAFVMMVTGGLGVMDNSGLAAAGKLQALVIVVVPVTLGGAHMTVGIVTFEGAKCPMSSFLTFMFFFNDLLPHLVGVVFLLYWVEAWKTGEKGLTSSLCSSLNACIFFWREGKGFTYLIHGLQLVDWVVWSFLKVWMPFTVLMVTLHLWCSLEGHIRSIQRESHRLV